MPAPQRSLKDVFLEALALPPAQRAAWLDEVCAGDADRRRHVDLMLAAHDAPQSFIDQFSSPAAATGAFAPALDAPAIVAESEQAGSVIGAFKLVEMIGEGGMGTVWMAQQTEPVKRLVALKVIKAGMDSKQVLARFEAERQALALMDHPNIAKVFDAGTTGAEPDALARAGASLAHASGSAGRPYFVMELVKGVAITKYCDDHRLTPQQRLELFVPVCQAIQHAHQKGIIHRDIKPSNVLVTLYDGKPVPKVIDFGIAKATGQQLTDRTLVTGFGNIVGTLEYMSPEQAEVNQLDIDTRSDIYSLGVLLYELLTGTTPLEKKRLAKAAMLEVLRLIREEEPPRPSTRLSDSNESLPSISAQRQMEPAKLTRLVRGELDWIVMKALDKDRNRRYESANGFAHDVQRYLADEPVQACPPSAWYRFRKFTRRNKSALAVAGLILFFIALLGGGGGWVVRDRAARKREEVHEREARQGKVANDLELALVRGELFQGQGKRAEALAALDRAELLAGEAPNDIGQIARLAALKERLAAEARDQEFVAAFENIRLLVYSQVDLQRSGFRWDAGVPAIRGALDRYGIPVGVIDPVQAVAHIQSRPAAVRQELIAALNECASRGPKEDKPMQQWLGAVVNVADNDDWRVRARKATVAADWEALAKLAREVDVQKQPPSFLVLVAGSLPTAMKAAELDLLRRTQRAYPGDLWANHWLGHELMMSGHAAEAVRYHTAALALRPKNPGIYLNRGWALQEAGDLDGAIADYRQALDLAPQYGTAHDNLGGALKAKGLWDDAIAEYREAIAINKDDARAHNNLGNALTLKGLWDNAIAEFRLAIAIMKDYSGAHNGLGYALIKKGQLDDAIAECRIAIGIERNFAPPRFNLATALMLRSRGPGDLDEAIAACREAIRLKNDFAEAHQLLGSALSFKGQLDDAIAQYRIAIRLMPDFAAAHYNLGFCLDAKGLREEAIAEYQKAIAIQPDYHEAHHNLGSDLRDKGLLREATDSFRKVVALKPNFAEAHCNLGQVLRRQGEFHEALEELRRGHALGSKDPRWRYPSAEWVRSCERQLELNGQLPAFLSGKATPASSGERIELAKLCTTKQLHGAAAEFYKQALSAEPKQGGAYRYNAACAAALAGCGQGKDADKLDIKDRARLRGQCLDWLRADLEAWDRQLDQETDEPGSAAKITKELQSWLVDPDLAGVREQQALFKLPQAERLPWRQLWGDVADTLARAQRKAIPETKSKAK